MQRVNDFVPFRSQLEHIVFDFHHETPHGVCAYLKAKKRCLTAVRTIYYYYIDDGNRFPQKMSNV